MTISEQNLRLSPGPLIILLQSLLIPGNGLRLWYHRLAACLLLTASVIFADGWRQEGKSGVCDLAIWSMVDRWRMQEKMLKYEAYAIMLHPPPFC